MTRSPPNSSAPEYSGPKVSYQGEVEALDRADLRSNGQQAYRMADVFFRVSDLAQRKLTENAIADAQVEGAKMGGLDTQTITVMQNGKPTEISVPKLTRAEGSGAVARAWNQAAETSFAMRLDTATMQHIQTAAAENVGNPEGLRQSLDGWRQGIMGAIPADYLPKYEHDLYAMAQPLITRAETVQMQQIASDQAIDAKLAADTLVGSMVINSGLGPEGAAVSAAMFKNYVDATVARVGPFFSEAEARQDIQNVLAQSGSGALQAAFEGAPDKRAMFEAFQAGKPVVSLPVVGEDGEVTAGLYDKDTLIRLVGPEKVQSQLNGLAVDIRMQEAEARAVAAEARAEQRERLASLQTDIQIGFPDAVAEAETTGKSPMTAAEIYAAYPREQDRKTAEKLVAKLALATQTGSMRKTLAGNTLAEDQAFLESLKPKPGTPDFAEQQALHSLAVNEYNNKIKELSSDPASYVMRTNTTVQQKWEEALDNDPAKIQAAVAATKQAQIDLGVAPENAQPMPTDHAAGLASTITTASPDTVAPLIDGIQAAYGDDGLNQVIGKGVPPMVKAVAFADAPEYGTWRQKAILAMNIPEKDLKDQAKARGVSESDVSDALDGLTVPLQDTLPAGASQPYLDAVRQVTLFNVANYGMDAKAAAADAWSVFDQAYTFNTGGSGKYRVPKKWDGEQVSSALTNVIGTLETRDIQPAIIGMGGAVDPAFAQMQTVNAIKRGHYRWVTDQKERGVILTYEEGNPVLLSNGEPLHLTFDELMLMPKADGAGVMIENLRGLSGTN